MEINITEELGVHGTANNDEQQLEEFNAFRRLIRDRTKGVALRYQTGFFLVGRGGTAKTHTVMNALDATEQSYLYRNCRMTPMGLFNILEQFPNHTIVLDDVTELFGKVEARQIFLAALDGDPGKPRPVPYVRDKGQRTVQFSGGIIAISNTPLNESPVLNALRSRVIPLEFDPTDEHIAAFMRLLAKRGYSDLSSAECRQVVDFIIAESKDCSHRLDLRHMTKGFQDYRQWRDGDARNSWQVLIRSSLRQRIILDEGSFREAQNREQRRIAAELQAKYPRREDKQARDDEWVALTGKSADTYYRCVRDMKREGVL